MLVLSRKKNESIVINDDIVVTVVDVRGDKVRLGIEAPKEIPVHRKEVHEAIQRGQKPYVEEKIVDGLKSFADKLEKDATKTEE